jgi:eukaryotic-like serine/threonine-protein kinase
MTIQTAATSGPQKLVGRYALHGEIAAGGMATVHLGRLMGPEGFARTVAIKQLHPHFAKDPDFVTMMLDEARLVARIRHPNVIPTLDVVQAEGELLIVMEYVAGETLSHLIRHLTPKRDYIPGPIVAAILSGVLHGLHAAHETRGDSGESLDVVHRDVSPQNVLVGSDGVARVLDFGVAKAMGRMTNTRSGHIKGKMAYMSMEQLYGRPVDRRSDIYAASVVLWETLTLTRLFQGENDPEVFGKVLQGASVPPSHVVPTVDRAFDAVVMRGLATDPTQRYATAREMARDLERCVGVATASDVTEWLEEHAAELLRGRAKRVSALESGSGIVPPKVARQTSDTADTARPPPADGAPTMISDVSNVRDSAGAQLADLAVDIDMSPPSSHSDSEPPTPAWLGPVGFHEGSTNVAPQGAAALQPSTLTGMGPTAGNENAYGPAFLDRLPLPEGSVSPASPPAEAAVHVALPETRPSRAPWIVAAAGFAVLALGGAFLLGRGGQSAAAGSSASTSLPAQAGSTVAPPPAPEAASADAVQPGLLADPASPAASATPDTTTAPTAPAQSATATVKAFVAHPVTTGPRPPAKAIDCNPPYYFDATGKKHYKRNCG